MAFDFPAAPVVGDEFTSGGVTFTWTGSAWAIGEFPILPLPAPIMQQLRTSVNNNPPSSLLPGQFAVEMGTPLRLWVGVPPALDPSGKKLLTDSGLDPYVNITGDTMTGDLTISKADPALILDKPASGSASTIVGKTNNLLRWAVLPGNNQVESGGNAGSNFEIARYNDAGAYIDSPMVVKRTDGLMIVNGPPVDAGGVATKAYVDALVTGAPLDALAQHSLIYNGSCEVQQDPDIAAGVTAHVTYICDGWINFKVGTVVNNAKQAVSNPGFFPGLNALIELQTTTAQAVFAASDCVAVYQPIEGYRLQRVAFASAAGLPLTLSFYSGHVRTGIYSGILRVSTTGGVVQSFAFEYTQAASGVPQLNQISIPPLLAGGLLSNTNSIGAYLMFAMAAGPNVAIAPGAWTNHSSAVGSVNQINGCAALTDRFRIGGISLMPSSVPVLATRAFLAMRPFEDELHECKRYYEIGHFACQAIQSSSMTGRGYSMPINFKVTKRAAPTMAFTNISATRCASPSAVAVHTNGFSSFTTNTAAGGDDIVWQANWSANSRMA